MIGRFINADTTDVLLASPTSLNNKNLYAYCDNNPVVRHDSEDTFWDTVLDIASVAGDIAEIAVNPTSAVAWASLAADVASMILPGVTGGGQIVRFVAKSDALLDSVKIADKVVDSSKAIKSTTDMGKLRHKVYNPIKRTTSSAKDAIINKAIKNTRYRPDAVDFTNRIIYELKPYNRYSYKKALRQTKRYADILGGDWTVVIDMYRR